MKLASGVEKISPVNFSYTSIRCDQPIYGLKYLQKSYDKRSGNKQSVEAIKEAAVTGQRVAAVFDLDASLQQRFHQITVCSADDDNPSDAQPLPLGDRSK